MSENQWVTKADQSKNKSSVRKKTKEGKVQDEVPFNELKRVGGRPCPFCKHDSLMKVQAADEIMAKNTEIREDHRARVLAWENAGSNGKKPACKRTVCQEWACYCGVQHCFLKASGKGCHNCLSMSENGVSVTSIQDPEGRPGKCLKVFNSNKYYDLCLDEEMNKPENIKAVDDSLHLGSILDKKLAAASLSLMHSSATSYDLTTDSKRKGLSAFVL